MPRVADFVAVALFCACYLVNLGTLVGADMIWSLAIFPIAVAYAYYSRHEIRVARRGRAIVPRAARRPILAAGIYATVALSALFAEQLVAGGVYNGRVVDLWGHVHAATRADVLREHGFLVFGLLGLAILSFAYPAARATYASIEPHPQSTTT